MGISEQTKDGETSNRVVIKKKDRTERQGMKETSKRGGEWAQECSIADHSHLKPQIANIPETEWWEKWRQYRRTYRKYANMRA